jgi:hypothetical protein
MKIRIVGLLLSLSIIALAIFAAVTVSKIVALGGDRYRWESIPPLLVLAYGSVLLGYWIVKIAKTK